MTKVKNRMTERSTPVGHLVLSGEVTVGVLGELQSRALSALDGSRTLHVDCRALSYLDAAGHQFLCALKREGATRGVTVHITPPAADRLAEAERLGMGGVFSEASGLINGEPT